MARIAIMTPPLAGHLGALSALAGRLIDRGHELTLIGPADAKRWLRDERIGFHAIGAGSHPPGALARDAKRMGRLQGLLGVPGMIRDLAALTELHCREAPGALRAIGADAAIVDQLEPGGAVAALAAGVPYSTVATGLHVNKERLVPPPFVGWRYDPTERGAWKVRGAYRVSDRLMAPIGDALQRWCTRYGLPPARDAADLVSPLCDMTQGVPLIDYPRASLPRTFHYVGPLRSPATEAFPDLDRLDPSRPLAFCSLGTLQGGRERLLRRIGLAALDEGCSVVLVHCGGLDAGAERALADEMGPNALVRDFVPQRAVLARANLAVVHGGFNTVLDALSHRTPMVVLPLAFEQPAIAARLERAGVAERLTPQLATRGRLRQAIRRVRDAPGIDERLGAVAGEIEAASGAERAADLVETILPAGAMATASPAADGVELRRAS